MLLLRSPATTALGLAFPGAGSASSGASAS